MPDTISNWIDGRAVAAGAGTIDKINPADGTLSSRISRSQAAEIDAAVTSARRAQAAWAAQTAVARGRILLDVAIGLREREKDIAAAVARETGKAPKEALGEVRGALQLAEYFAGEGMRLYGRSLQSGTPHKYTHSVRQPLGVAALIVAANTPIANAAWKIFPALICGNTAVLKAPEDAPQTAYLVGEIAGAAGLPPGVLNIVQGLGGEAGQALVDHPGVNVISFTGSTSVGRRIAESAGKRLVRLSLELGGKNPLVVCDDADIENAVKWTMLSAFSNAGQRCAASSRVIVFDAVYDKFRDQLVAGTARLKIGNTDNDDFGPVINLRQLNGMLNAIGAMRAAGAKVLIGGERLGGVHAEGCYLAPTVIENLPSGDALSDRELFGPVTVLYRVRDFAEALTLANDTAYGLTAAIHTRSVHRAMEFAQKVRAGTVNINAGTYGSEPHFPFGGFGASGNGTREPGVEALDVYTETKTISFIVDPGRL